MVTFVAMAGLDSLRYNNLRTAVGLPTTWQPKEEPPPPASAEKIAALLGSSRPFLVAVIGSAGIAIILWLMMFKPF